MGGSEVLNQVLVMYITFGIICAAIFIFYFIYSGGVSRKEEALVFWIVIATIGVASFFLWPIFSMLLLWSSGNFNKKSSHRHSSDAKVGEDYCSSTSPDLEKIRSLWNEITDRSSALNSDLIDYLEGDEVLSENERVVRNQFYELERLFSEWNGSISSFMKSLPSNLPDQNLKYFSPNENWPKLNLRIIVKYDINGKPVGVSHSTIRTLVPNFEDSFVSYFPSKNTRHQNQRTERYNESDWKFSVSGKFERAMKKIKELERNKIEKACEKILLSPASAMGSVRKPLSKNLKGLWRYRLGDWRLIYCVNEESHTVTFVDYVHRSKVYH